MYDADFPAHFWYRSTGKNSAIEFNQDKFPSFNLIEFFNKWLFGCREGGED